MKTRNLKTKTLSILLAIVMLLSMLPMSVFAADNSTDLIITGGTAGTDYTYENGVLDIKAAGTYEIKNADSTTATTDAIRVSAASGKVIVKLGGVNIKTIDKSAFQITGDCETIVTLADESVNVLDASEANEAGAPNQTYRFYTGLENGEKSLIISCENVEKEEHICTDDCGTLVARGGFYGAGIGGADTGNGSNITISGGIVTATSETGAGIGGGHSGNAENITISGGIVTATSETGAGIGGGEGITGSRITISGGTVTATSERGAGIGGGADGIGDSITISGGTVTATSGQGAGIGGGYEGNGSSITISGGTVTATSETSAGIGGGENGNGSNIKFAPSANKEIIVNTGANVSEAEELTYAFAKETDITELVSGNAYFHSETTEHNHTGGTPTCIEDAICTVCGGTYRDWYNHADLGTSEWLVFNDAYHYRICLGCRNIESVAEHIGGTATCKDKAVCTDCGSSYGETNPQNHTYGTDWKSDGTNHWHECSCGAKTEETAHSGGTATCTDKAKCVVCAVEYGELAAHTYGTEWKSDGANHWHECSCGAKADEATHSGGTASCTVKAACSACGVAYGELAAHTYEKGKCTVCEAVDPDYVPESSSPQTGDNSHMALWIALLFISSGAVITLTVYDRKRRSVKH